MGWHPCYPEVVLREGTHDLSDLINNVTIIMLCVPPGHRDGISLQQLRGKFERSLAVSHKPDGVRSSFDAVGNACQLGPERAGDIDHPSCICRVTLSHPKAPGSFGVPHTVASRRGIPQCVGPFARPVDPHPFRARQGAGSCVRRLAALGSDACSSGNGGLCFGVRRHLLYTRAGWRLRVSSGGAAGDGRSRMPPA